MADILHEIVERKRGDAPEDGIPSERTVPRRPFPGPGFSIIAEVKKASPSKGVFHPERDPVELARAYERGGAGAVSVLTERNYFRGSMGDLMAVRGAVDLPVLRKDFLTERAQLEAAWAAGADAALLIAAVLGPKLGDLVGAARDLGITAFVEIHDDAELELAIDAGAELLGINNRDLKTFEVDVETCHRLKRSIPDAIPVVAESGFDRPEEIRRLREAGFAGVLIGESLVTAPDPEGKLAELVRAAEAAS